MAEHSQIGTILTLGAVGIGAYYLYEWYLRQPAGGTVTNQPAPGTTQPGQPVSTTQPPPSDFDVLVAHMQNVIGMTAATADQWNWAYSQIAGQGIDIKYNFDFDTAYGAVQGGARSSGTMPAAMFLHSAAAAVPGGIPGMSGLGSAIVRYPGPRWNTTGNMLFRAHHPLPYYQTQYQMRGLGALTRATRFERVLWGQR